MYVGCAFARIKYLKKKKEIKIERYNVFCDLSLKLKIYCYKKDLVFYFILFHLNKFLICIYN